MYFIRWPETHEARTNQIFPQEFESKALFGIRNILRAEVGDTVMAKYLGGGRRKQTAYIIRESQLVKSEDKAHL